MLYALAFQFFIISCSASRGAARLVLAATWLVGHPGARKTSWAVIDKQE